MTNDSIDDSGFELGKPTHLEMLKHQCDLLYAELETARHDLRKAHKDIAGLIVMHRDGTRELTAMKIEHERLKVEHERLRWTLSDMNSRESPHTLVYAYGDYSKR
ncbi:hypothetical protein [Pseudomonas sp. GL-RE-20]|uniref:hypothetical protein n=1 Tax=Pseudomonas sp. GL-RE-20 TaxID=2832372 RepID=UPI001CBC51C4|nr:hypothetical protein [Pseudomonas sp. GL-RE-20]